MCEQQKHTVLPQVPALDGVRGLSVLFVAFSHFPLAIGALYYNSVWKFSNALRLSYIFLDFFFLLSGFLITRILLSEKVRTGTISFSNFYFRRTLRIFPIYYLAALACGLIFQLSPTVRLSLLTYTYNFLLPFHPTPMPLEQTWSLAVEEQFYLIWPMVILFVPTMALSRVTGLIVPLTAIAAGLALSVWAGTGDQLFSGNLVYMSTFTRMMSLSFGAWLAVREYEKRPISASSSVILILCGLSLLGLDRFGRSSEIIASQGTYWTIALMGYSSIGVAVIGTILFNHSRFGDLLRLVLSFAPLRGIGRISYGLYLYHLPVLFYFGLNDAVMQGGQAPIAVVALAAVVIFTISIVSYLAIEKPLLRLRGKSDKGRLKPTAAE